MPQLPIELATTARSRPLELGASCLLVLFLGGCSMFEGKSIFGDNSIFGPRSESSSAPLFEQMSEDDLRLADQSVQQALTVAISGTTFAWQNTANGNSGTVTPKSTLRTSEGTYCRTYVETITINRKSELYENTACIDDSGTWKSAR